MLKGHQDAFGHGMLDFLDGIAGREIVERDDGYVEVSIGPEAYFWKYREWPQIERKALKYARGRVFDIGCGAGRHALHLQAKGLEVLGIDNSPLAIQVSKRRGLINAEVMSIAQTSSFNTSPGGASWCCYRDGASVGLPLGAWHLGHLDHSNLRSSYTNIRV